MSTKPAAVVSNQVVLHVSPQFIKRIPDPHDSRRWSYVGTVPALEAIKLLRGTANPRAANLKGNVADDIRDTIHNEPRDFHFMNRGLIVSAPDAELDTDNKTLTLENPTVENPNILWGVLDGGHTLDVLKEQAAAVAADDPGASSIGALKDTWVDVKFRVGLTKDEVISAALANNTSAQLRPWTLANFKGQLQPLKQIVAKEMPDLAGDIAFKENETNEATGEERTWDVLHVLQRATLLNVALFPGFEPAKQPVIAYASKSKVLDLYLEDPSRYESMSPTILSAFRMPAIVEAKLSHLPKINGNLAFVAKAKSGEVDHSLKFLPGPANGYHTGYWQRKYRISDAVLFPIVSALRPLIEMDGGKQRWLRDEVQFVEDHISAIYDTFLSFYRDEVADKTKKASLSGMGKDARLWQILHAKVLAILAAPKRK